MKQRVLQSALAISVSYALAVGSGFATPLDKDACTALSLEAMNLKRLDSEKLLGNDPASAMTNMSPGELFIIRRAIEIDEQIKFRCTPANALIALKGQEPESDAAPQADTAQTPENKSGDIPPLPSRRKTSPQSKSAAEKPLRLKSIKATLDAGDPKSNLR